jgi:hypothetical protein
MSFPWKQNKELFSFSYQSQMMGAINGGVSVGITVSILAKKKKRYLSCPCAQLITRYSMNTYGVKV